MVAGRPADSELVFPRQGRPPLDAGRLTVLASAGVQSGDAGGWSGARVPIRLAPQLRCCSTRDGASSLWRASLATTRA
jgi:hypothetical protein